MKLTQSKRLLIVWIVMGCALAGLLWRLIDLSIIDRSFLLHQSQARILRTVITPGHRGIISDRLGSPLAVSTVAASVWINPQAFYATPTQLNKMAQLLGVSAKFIRRRANKKTHHEFAYIKRAVSMTLADKVKAMQIDGVYFQQEFRRYYPEGEVTAHVIGFTDIDDRGQEGAELEYNPWLRGQPGKTEVLKDRLGHVITEIATLKKPKQGENIQLSIDHRIQYLAYQSLKKAVDTYHASSGSVVVLDVETGEVLAMVNQPSYDPNRRHGAIDGRYRNRAVTDVFEPGSVVKPFTIALALESGKYTPDTKIDTNHGWMKIGGYRIRDDLDYGIVTLTELLQKSSNIAAAKILLSLQPQHYWRLLMDLGFGGRTHSGFPGEATGRVAPQATWVPSVVATLAYGYGVSVTTLQLAKAYSILAADGLKRPVSLLKINQSVQGERVLPEKVSREVVSMLKTVIHKGGTGTRAQVPGYEVAGKTGTAYIAGPHGYYHHRYVASFVGMAPAAHPKLVVAVVVKDPKNKHFGGLVAAPVFSEIMRGALRFLNVSPSR